MASLEAQAKLKAVEEKITTLEAQSAVVVMVVNFKVRQMPCWRIRLVLCTQRRLRPFPC
jgi:hypothetical protein